MFGFAELSIFQTISIALFGFIFGFFEFTTNFYYLISKNYDLPRKQHSKELPKSATNSQVFHKVVQMFILGLVLLLISLIAILIAPQLFTVGAAFILINGLIDYSKFRKSKMIIIWVAISIIACTLVMIPL